MRHVIAQYLWPVKTMCDRREMCPEMSDDNESWDNQRFDITFILI